MSKTHESTVAEAEPQASPTRRPATTHTVTGGAGLELHVREWGDRHDPPILFIHGWSQSHQCWSKQYRSDLVDRFRLVALDIRGHGMSDKPLEPEHYTDGDRWADDIASVIETLELDRPVLVGWSYGGYIIGDYVRRHGDKAISGVNFVAAAVEFGAAAPDALIGPGFLDHFDGSTAADLPTNIDAIRSFLRAAFAKPLDPDVFEIVLCSNMVVPPEVRAHMVQREIDNDVLRTLSIDALVTHGTADLVVLPAMAERIAETCPVAELSWYEGVGHAPFLEDPERFNTELASFTQRSRTA